MDADELRRAVAGVVVVEVGWREDDGSVRAAARTPLVYDPETGLPTLALTYDDAAVAAALDRADRAVVVVSDSRLVLQGWQPAVWTARPEVEADPEAHEFLGVLVDQELRKHPPSRMRADSLLQQREHWWYVARLLVRFSGVEPIGEPAARTAPDEGVLVWSSGDGLQADTVSVDDWSAERLRLQSLAGPPSDGRGGGPAALLRHDYSDDFERRAHLLLTGRLSEDTFEVANREGSAALPPVPSWWQRLREAKRLERACRRAIRAAGH